MRGFSAIGLYGTKYTVNEGGVLRAASCFGAKLIVLAAPRFKKSSADTTNAYKHIPVIRGDPWKLIPINCVPVAVEVVDGCRWLSDFTHPRQAMYLFGPEDGSLPKKVIERCNYIVRIPSIHCLNLAAAVNVVLYDRTAKEERWKEEFGSLVS